MTGSRGRPRAALANSSRALIGSVAVRVLVASVTWLIAAAAPEYAEDDSRFSLLTALIIAGAFSLIASYGWLLRPSIGQPHCNSIPKSSLSSSSFSAVSVWYEQNPRRSSSYLISVLAIGPDR